MSFGELRRRVSAALSAENRLKLNLIVSKKISSEGLDCLDGTVFTFQKKVKTLKYSIITLVKTEKLNTNVLQHLLEIVFDFISTHVSKEETTSIQEPSVKIQAKGSSINKLKSKKNLQVQVSKIVNPVVNTDDPVEVQTSDQMVVEEIPTIKEVRFEGCTPPLTQASAPASQSSSKLDDAKVRRKRTRIKSGKVGSSGSVSPAAPHNGKALRLHLEDAHVDSVLDAKEVVNAYWGFVANIVTYKSYDQWLDLPPTVFGLNCNCIKISRCPDCITALLSTPITDCQAVNCTEDTHTYGLFAHSPLKDFDSNSYHGVTKEMVEAQHVRVRNASELPSLFYVMLYDKNATKFLKPSSVITKLKKTVEFLSR